MCRSAAPRSSGGRTQQSLPAADGRWILVISPDQSTLACEKSTPDSLARLRPPPRSADLRAWTNHLCGHGVRKASLSELKRPLLRDGINDIEQGADGSSSDGESCSS